MSERNVKLLIEDMIGSICKIEKYIDKVNFNDFMFNEEKSDAVLKNHEVIGEAANRLPEHFRDKYPEIPWQRIIGTRHRVIHEYFGISYPIVWNIITEKLPELKTHLEKIILQLNE